MTFNNMEHISKSIRSYDGQWDSAIQTSASMKETGYEEASLKPPDFMGKSTTYNIVYDGLTSRFNLTPIEILVLARIIGLSKNGKPCIASQLTFASTFNVSTPTAREALKRLESKGVIRKTGKLSIYLTHEMVLSSEASSYLKNLRAQIEFKKTHNEEKKRSS